MLYYLTVAAILLHTFFWGIGLAWLTLPRTLRQYWWALAPGFGMALQSAVVWGMAHTPVAGTGAYVWYSELLPAVLALVAWRIAAPRRRWRLRSLLPLALVMLAVGWMLLSPMARRGAWTLTSSSLGSNDHADYAAGARVLQEFARDDREGFMGLSEVTKVGSTDYFFDFWLRLNHFTPSALIAHHGALLGLQPYQLVSLSTVVLVLLNLPLVLLLARVALGLRGWLPLAITLVYGLSPLTAYAVHHGALGQLYAAHGIALLTLIGLTLPVVLKRGGSMHGHFALAVAAVWLLAGSYNFILTVAFVPAVAWLLLDAWHRRQVRPALRAGAVFSAALALCAVLFWGRFGGMIERFRLFDEYDFGWPVALLSPEGWLGMVKGTALTGWPVRIRAVLSFVAVALWLAGMVKLWQGQRPRALAALALTLPILGGFGLLAWESQDRVNASYDAFKLLSVFYPGLLAGLCCWAAAFRQNWGRKAVMVLLVALLAANLWPASRFWRRMAHPPLRVERVHLEIGRLEADAEVASINMRIESFWVRLWANSFLLKKPQYFSAHTYEGRLNTPLRGEWDLIGALVRSEPLHSGDIKIINSRFHAVRANAPGRVTVSFGEGWYPMEGTGINRWRWTAGGATLHLHHLGSHPLWIRLDLRGRAVTSRELELWCNGEKIQSHVMDRDTRTYHFGTMFIQPGDNVIRFHSNQPPTRPGHGDDRELSIALYGMVVRALPTPSPGN